MAENENGQEKTEEPTGKRVRESREKGQVPRSKELNTVIELIVASTFMLLFGSYLGIGMANQFADSLTLERDMLFDPAVLPAYFGEQFGRALLNLSPLLGLLAVAALIGPVIIGGANFSSQALQPKFSKLNPIKGMKRFVSPTGLMELGKALGKFLLVGGVAAMVLSTIVDEVLMLGEEPVKEAIIHSAHLAAWVFLMVSAVLILIALIDVPFQLWNHNKQLKMTLQEVKDEHKETEGKPEVKGKIRQMQMEMAQRRMMSEVPKADVIITNPTHYAVAISYKPGAMSAPRLLAKGVDDVAFKIRELAEEHLITTVEAPKVARAIYFTTELNKEIPGGLFVAVARILAYVYQLKRPNTHPSMPHDLPVPEEYLDPTSARRARRAH
ncbi:MULTISPECIES: flagellar biosynthesis protein FlhB [Thiorhodovibrio]|jgi:flagellar biosynthetic protein FlhB|uniref:flagellar biosynthesis protein FlhB n=1 Tax=Thiorhodovibrio TaxID=61593 RepID=UPI001911B5A1|nr:MULTISPECIES: flagellar biosynthesis protein FlhB [Thiorhodovibrio]MBK5971015.1 flagellar biosynthesis protein FlhB [Thiorhodovibrio winogradskyi]WPL10618.1 Flagellar biosynthetic protein FlhB [Thiorhodovibrio litoralis]